MDEHEAADLVVANLPATKYPQIIIDVILLSVIGAVVSQLVTLCFDKLKEPKVRQDPNALQQRKLRRVVKRQCPSREYYLSHGDTIHEALLNTGKVIEPAQMAQLAPLGKP